MIVDIIIVNLNFRFFVDLVIGLVNYVWFIVGMMNV